MTCRFRPVLASITISAADSPPLPVSSGVPPIAMTLLPSGEAATPVGNDCSGVMRPAGNAGRPVGSGKERAAAGGAAVRSSAMKTRAYLAALCATMPDALALSARPRRGGLIHDIDRARPHRERQLAAVRRDRPARAQVADDRHPPRPHRHADLDRRAAGGPSRRSRALALGDRLVRVPERGDQSATTPVLQREAP